MDKPGLKAHLPASRAQSGRIGLLGGSFNPAHAGHRHISLIAMRKLKLDEVWWMVAPQNPLKSKEDMAPFAERFASARHVARRHPQLKVTDVERWLGTRYTADTIEALQEAYPRMHFVWLMGADNLAGLHQWKDWKKLVRRVPILVVDRAPYTLQALSSPAAISLGSARLPLRMLRKLPFAKSPAWAYLTLPRHPESATRLRKMLGKAAFEAYNKP